MSGWENGVWGRVNVESWKADSVKYKFLLAVLLGMWDAEDFGPDFSTQVDEFLLWDLSIHHGALVLANMAEKGFEQDRAVKDLFRDLRKLYERWGEVIMGVTPIPYEDWVKDKL